MSSLYNEMQKMNERENKAEPGTHLCIDVEDAVSTMLLIWYVFCSVVECAFSIIIPFRGILESEYTVFKQK